MADDIPTDQHFMRYIKRRYCRTGKDGQPFILPATFLLRDNEEYLSGMWYEFLEPSSEGDALKKALTLLSKTFTKLNGAFSLHKVGEITAKSDKKIQYAVRHLPSHINPAHSGIFSQPVTLYDAEVIAKTINRIFLL